jgi:hypothetical protein
MIPIKINNLNDMDKYNLYKVEKIYGPNYDPITKDILFSFNDIIKHFSGKTSDGDSVIKKQSTLITDHNMVLFSSEMIADMFSGLWNRDYWIQESFKQLSFIIPN